MPSRRELRHIPERAEPVSLLRFAKALRLLREDKQYRYAYLVPNLLRGPDDEFLVDYLLRCKSDFDFPNGAGTLERVKVSRKHIPHLESLAAKGYDVGDVAILHLVNFDRERYLPELCKEPNHFSAERRKLLEADVDAEEELPDPVMQAPPRRDQHGDPLPPGALARLGTVRLRVQSPVEALAFAPDGKTFATTDQDGSISIWDAITGKEIRRLRASSHGLLSLTFSPDGKILFSGDQFGTVCLWDVASGKEQRQFSGSNAGVCSLALSSDGKRLASGNTDGSAYLWEPASGRLLRALRRPGRPGRPVVAITRDGRTIAVGGRGTRVTLFDSLIEKATRTLGLRDAEGFGNITAILFAADGASLYTGGSDGTIRHWELSTGKDLRQFTNTHPALLPKIDVALSPDGRMLAWADEADVLSASIVLCDTASGKQVRQLRLPGGVPHVLAFSPDGKTLAAAGSGPVIGLWDTATGRERCPAAGRQAIIKTVAFTPDGRALAAAGADGAVRLYEPATGKCLRTIAASAGDLSQISFTADGSTLLALGWLPRRVHQQLSRWDVARCERLEDFDRGAALNTSVFSADRQLLATSNDNQDIRIRDASSGKKRFVIHVDPEAAAFTFDNKLLAVADKKGLVRLLELATGKETAQCQALPSDIWFLPGESRVALGLSPDGRMLATAAERDTVVRLWETATGGERNAFGGEHNSFRILAKQKGGIVLGGRDRVHAFAFSPDSKLLAIAQGSERSYHSDHAITVWDVTTGKQLRRMEELPPAIETLAFSPDGTMLVSVSRDTTAVVWDMRGIRTARRTGRPLPPAELQTLWSDLTAADAARAHRSMTKLMAAPGQTTALLRDRLRPVSSAEMQRLAQHVADLDSDRFAVRTRATAALRAAGLSAAPALRARLKGAPSLELRRRAEALLNIIDHPALSPAHRRQVRAVEVLERIATPEARKLLATLAAGAADAWLTRAAQASLERLEGRATAARGRPRAINGDEQTHR